MQIDHDNLKAARAVSLKLFFVFTIVCFLGIMVYTVRLVYNATEHRDRCKEEYQRFMEHILMYCEKKSIEECYNDLASQKNITHNLIYYLQQCMTLP